MQQPLVGFALRLSPEMKRLAAAMVAVRSMQGWRNGLTLLPIECSTINGAINALMREGLNGVELAVDSSLADCWQPQLDHVKPLMQYLMLHPEARHVRPDDLPEASAARARMVAYIDASKDREPENSFDRASVTEEYDDAQDWVLGLTAVKDAISQVRASGK